MSNTTRREFNCTAVESKLNTTCSLVGSNENVQCPTFQVNVCGVSAKEQQQLCNDGYAEEFFRSIPCYCDDRCLSKIGATVAFSIVGGSLLIGLACVAARHLRRPLKDDVIEGRLSIPRDDKPDPNNSSKGGLGPSKCIPIVTSVVISLWFIVSTALVIAWNGIPEVSSFEVSYMFISTSFMVFWLFSNICLVLNGARGIYLLRHELAKDDTDRGQELKKARRADDAGGAAGGGVHHLIVLPNFREEVDLMRATIQRLAKQKYVSVKDDVTVVLAMEQGEEGYWEKGMKLRDEFLPVFRDVVVTCHPRLPGEQPGKSSNMKWAYAALRRFAVSGSGSGSGAVVDGDVESNGKVEEPEGAENGTVEGGEEGSAKGKVEVSDAGQANGTAEEGGGAANGTAVASNGTAQDSKEVTSNGTVEQGGDGVAVVGSLTTAGGVNYAEDSVAYFNHPDLVKRTVASPGFEFDPQRTVATLMDADALSHPRFLATLGKKFIETDGPTKHLRFWQCPVAFYENLDEIDFVNRAVTIVFAFNELANTGPIDLGLVGTNPRMPVNTYSMSWRLFDLIDGGDNFVVADESHNLFKSVYLTKGLAKLEPIFLPISVYNVTSDHFLTGFNARFTQIKRWMYGNAFEFSFWSDRYVGCCRRSKESGKDWHVPLLDVLPILWRLFVFSSINLVQPLFFCLYGFSWAFYLKTPYFQTLSTVFVTFIMTLFMIINVNIFTLHWVLVYQLEIRAIQEWPMWKKIVVTVFDAIIGVGAATVFFVYIAGLAANGQLLLSSSGGLSWGTEGRAQKQHQKEDGADGATLHREDSAALYTSKHRSTKTKDHASNAVSRADSLRYLESF